MKVKLNYLDKGCCAKNCDFKFERWCNLFFEELYGDIINPTRCGNCQNLTTNNIEIIDPRFNIELVDTLCYGCKRYNLQHENNCTAGMMCEHGSLNQYKE